MPTSINYSFIQHFRVSADSAYKWCTDYDPADLALMHESGKRNIEQLSEDTFLLTDTYLKDDGETTKTKLVKLHPSNLSWTNTHLTGPVKYSQFLYKINPEGKDKSRLEFVGLQLEPRDMTKKEAIAFARKVRKEDSLSWKHLGKAMEKELRSQPRARSKM
jgi:hypothetical protein